MPHKADHTYMYTHVCVSVRVYTYTYIYILLYTSITQAFLIQEVKFYEVICIINFKNTLFKGFTRGDPWAPSLVKQNLKRTQNHEVFTA
jgi:hypothetical protein